MAPKQWNNKCTIAESQLVLIVSENATLLQRACWKTMDPSQIAGHLLPLLKSVGKFTVRLSKVGFLRALRKAQLSLTSSELSLLVEKVSTCLAWVKARLRDAGSGARLPAECSSLIRIWERYHFTKMQRTKQD